MWRGPWREGITGTVVKGHMIKYIKDTWTKRRWRVEVREGGGFGWGEVEGWGENTYDCN